MTDLKKLNEQLNNVIKDKIKSTFSFEQIKEVILDKIAKEIQKQIDYLKDPSHSLEDHIGFTSIYIPYYYSTLAAKERNKELNDFLKLIEKEIGNIQVSFDDLTINTLILPIDTITLTIKM